MLRSLLAAVLGALLVLSVVAAPVAAKKPVRPNAALAAATFAVVTTDDTEIHAGDVVTFTATTDAPFWRFWLLCYQGGRVVIDGRGSYFPAGSASVTYGMTSGAYAQNPVGGDCEVWVAEWVGFGESPTYGVTVIPEPLRFPLLP